MTNLRVGLIQMNSTTELGQNTTDADRLVRDAVQQGAELVSLPEVANLCQKDRDLSRKMAQMELDDPFLAHMKALAKELGVWLHLGSLVVLLEDDERMANRAYMINPEGEIAAWYDKIHMFDVDLRGNESYRESDSFRPGDRAVLADTPWGKIGLTICYDVRFPHLHRTLAQAGARIILGAAAFTQQTGDAHWHILQRARAIENGCFIVSAAQTGKHDDGRRTYGHSVAVGPWGEVIMDAGTEIGAFVCDLDIDLVDKTRNMVPNLRNGRDYDLV